MRNKVKKKTDGSRELVWMMSVTILILIGLAIYAWYKAEDHMILIGILGPAAIMLATLGIVVYWNKSKRR
jgi:Na+/proline symporter